MKDYDHLHLQVVVGVVDRVMCEASIPGAVTLHISRGREDLR